MKNKDFLHHYPYMADVDCWECPLTLPGYPELFAHLKQDHAYNETNALESIESEIAKLPKTESGVICGTCPDHGLYPLDDWECPGCRNVDRAIDRWQEERR